MRYALAGAAGGAVVLAGLAVVAHVELERRRAILAHQGRLIVWRMAVERMTRDYIAGRTDTYDPPPIPTFGTRPMSPLTGRPLTGGRR